MSMDISLDGIVRSQYYHTNFNTMDLLLLNVQVKNKSFLYKLFLVMRIIYIRMMINNQEDQHFINYIFKMELNMKTKMTLAAVLLGALVSSSAFANTGTINFIGSVSDTTCDFVGEQGGAQGNSIDLGTYNVAAVNGDTTSVVDFALVGKKTDGTACEIEDGKSVDVSWIPASGAWDAMGLQNTGTATNTAVKLMDKTGKEFSAVRDTVNYGPTDVVGGALPFKAQLVKSGVATAGTVISAAKFAVAYK